MAHIRRLFILFLCALMLTTVVYADSGATKVDTRATVASNGNCQITMTVVINMDSPATGLTFPLPRGAKDVAVNGKSARTYSSSTDPDVVLTDLSFLNGYMGESTVTFSYTLSDVLYTQREEKTNKSHLMMSIPLLSGFDYPVQYLAFSVTMPGDVTGKKASFTSAFFKFRTPREAALPPMPAAAASRAYFSPAAWALQLITAGSSMALSLPWGT